ncbi:DUF4405 domain-containing protein [Salinilacihabitans rarus]|uniref:DUF4405 domain-containing protein n=1 Tax=Salinilacihabitans rarus TaxID=2961596 RepID=UPI0020C9131B|nr:DUF4405 domain-containing protein [Salinilacihabitans rarus]
MNRRTQNLSVNLLLFAAFLVVLASGVVLWQVLPGGGTSRGLDFVGLVRGDWTRVHVLASLTMTALVAVHLALHWRYVRAVPKLLRS